MNSQALDIARRMVEREPIYAEIRWAFDFNRICPVWLRTRVIHLYAFLVKHYRWLPFHSYMQRFCGFCNGPTNGPEGNYEHRPDCLWLQLKRELEGPQDAPPSAGN